MAAMLTALAFTHAPSATAQNTQTLRSAAQAIADPFASTAQAAAQNTAAQTPAARGATKPAAAPKPDADTQAILDTLKTLPETERRAMVVYYKDLGLDLSPWLQDGSGSGTANGRRRQLVRQMRTVNFVRRPEAVLGARSQIGMESQSLPAEDAPDQEIIQWFHRHAMAAEWDAVKALLVLRAGNEAEGMYAALISGTNHADSELIPEDVLGLSEAAPAELTEWQIDALAGLLKAAAKKTSTRPLIQRFRQGTTWFGTETEAHRKRTMRLLLAAGLPIEAFEFMPSLEEAREAENAAVMKGHAEYLMARAAEAKGAASDRMLENAWSLFGEIALLDSADTALRSECLSSAVDLLPRVPPGPGLAWLRSLFEHPSLAPAGLQAVALKALKLEDEKLPEAVRAQAILTMKEAVDTLLAQQHLQLDQLTIPLRMLTIGLLSRAENAIKEQAKKNGVSEVAALLLRSMPDEAWRKQIEPSLVGRAYNAFIGVALIADETDLALELLAQGVKRQPAMSTELATEFLDLWVDRMQARTQEPVVNNNVWFYAFSRRSRPSTPVTRGWQQRNLDRLAELLDVLDGIGIDGRKLPGVVTALSACYGPTQAYERDTVQRILGPIEQIDASVAGQLASTMRQGLSGDWRSRKAQEDAGFERSESELRKIVETGYDLATALAESAVDNSQDEQDAWQHAILKAALSFDRMQFRGEREQDAAAYHAARKLVFSAFEDAASRYREALADGRVRPDMQIYNVWFSLALGASDLGALTLEDLMTEGMENADQIDRIRDDILKMTPEHSNYHIGEFARGVMSGLSETKPEVKPRLLQAAARVVGDHPAGAPIRRTLDLYHELVEDEIHLQLTIDGSDRVGTEPFGAVLTLQHTASIDRSSGGFARYLMDSFSQFNAGQWQTINYQERLQKSIEKSFSGTVQLLGIDFFQPMNPAVPIRLEGQSGWQEKPMAYLVLQAADPSVDRLPAVQMDMHFNDASGPIVLPVLSNTVLIDAAADPAPRPLDDLVIEQTLDARPMLEKKDEQNVRLEIVARATGVLPEINQLFDNLANALPGYVLDETQLVADPFDVSQTHRAQPEEEVTSTNRNPYMAYSKSLPNLDPDSDGLFRLGTMRKWSVTYIPEHSVAAAKPDRFIFPAVSDARAETLVSLTVPKKTPDETPGGTANTAAEAQADVAADSPISIKRFTYEDYDLVPVESQTLRFDSQGIPAIVWLAGGLAALLLVALIVWRLRHAKPESLASTTSIAIPESLTPTAATLLLRRIEQTQSGDWPSSERAALRADINALQRQHFADAEPQNGDAVKLHPTVQRWARRAGT
ncbi:protein disulfide isomerase [Rhodopirellula maiorica SM1]|uniref:Protein disulfide isomerase n=2 Tax=Novipirellula TaxID=2795426 RepID=M5RFK8_9BACT|nr:protein disulfide isomerase [Rhodopirellula maiorica SM1]